MPRDIPGIERIAAWDENLIWALEVLAALRESFQRDPYDVFVERLRTSLLLDATEAARYLGVFRLANLDRFFRTLQEAMDARGNDPQVILRSLRKSISEGREAEEGRPKEAAENAVQVMTVHGSKGLHGRQHLTRSVRAATHLLCDTKGHSLPSPGPSSRR